MRRKNRFMQISGAITAFRRTEPAKPAIGAIRIGERWVRVRLDDLSHRDAIVRTAQGGVRRDAMDVDESIAALERTVGQKVDIGVRVNNSGDCSLFWLVSDSIQLNRKTPAEVREGASEGLERWFPWMMLWLVLSALGGYCLWIMASFVVLLLSFVPFLALLISVVVCYSNLSDLYLSHFDGPLKASWQALTALESGNPLPNQNDLPSSTDAVAAQIEHDLSVPARDDLAAPPLRRICGQATHITVDTAAAGGAYYIGGRTVDNRIDYRCFHFNIGAESFSWFAASPYGLWKAGTVFLAEGDQVAVVVMDDASQRSADSNLVLGLHNLEDQQTYVCHNIMASQAKRLRRPFMGDYRSAAWTQCDLQRVSWILKLGWLLMIVIFRVFDETGVIDDIKMGWWVAIGFSTLIMVMMYAIFALPLIPWLIHRPTARQRLADRIYALLGLPSAFNLPANVHIV